MKDGGRSVGTILRAEWLLLAVAVLYAVAFAASPGKAWLALAAGARVLASVSVIIVAVFGLVGLIGVLVDKRAVASHLGESSGLRAVVGAALFGTVLVGPVYVVFPLLKSVREHGARWAVVTAVLTAWAVKVPMLPLEMGFLGVRFAVVRVAITFAGAIMLGLSVERLVGDRTGHAPAVGERDAVRRVSETREVGVDAGR